MDKDNLLQNIEQLRGIIGAEVSQKTMIKINALIQMEIEAEELSNQ